MYACTTEFTGGYAKRMLKVPIVYALVLLFVSVSVEAIRSNKRHLPRAPCDGVPWPFGASFPALVADWTAEKLAANDGSNHSLRIPSAGVFDFIRRFLFVNWVCCCFASLALDLSLKFAICL